MTKKMLSESENEANFLETGATPGERTGQDHCWPMVRQMEKDCR